MSGHTYIHTHIHTHTHTHTTTTVRFKGLILRLNEHKYI